MCPKKKQLKDILKTIWRSQFKFLIKLPKKKTVKKTKELDNKTLFSI